MPLVRAALVGVVLMLGLVALGPARRVLAWAGRSPDWAVVVFCRALLVLLGIRVETAGRSAGPGAPRLLVANHVSWIDILALASVEPLCFLAKSEVASWPVIGDLAVGHGTVFIDRRRRRGILAANAALAERLGRGRSLLLFPEGTTHDGRRRGRFLTSHLACLRERQAAPAVGTMIPAPAAETSVQAVGLAYSDPIAAWIGEGTLLPHVWAVLRRPGLTCRLHYGAPLAVPPGFDRKALGLVLAGTVEDLLAEAPRGVPVRSSNGHAPGLASV